MRAARSGEHWFFLAVALALPLGLAAVGLFLEPDARGYGTHEQLGLWPCASMKLFAVPCPGCGVTTSIALALRGRIQESFLNQPFGIVVLLLALAFFGWSVKRHAQGLDLYASLRGTRWTPWGIAFTTALAISWVYKLAIT